MHTASAQKTQKLPKQVEKIQKKAKMPSVKTVPDPLNESLYIDPVTTFTRAHNTYLNTSYLQTLRESKPAKDSLTYTRTMHAAAVQDAINFDKTYSFDFTQYVRFTDWNGKFTFLTMHHNAGNGNTALELLDSNMVRHTLIVNPEKKQTIHMARDRAHKVSITVLPILLDRSTVAPLISPSAFNLGLRNASAETLVIVGVKGTKINVEEAFFNKASITYSENYVVSKYSMTDVLQPWLPVQAMHVASNMSLKAPILLEIASSYGDKPFYTSTWKTVKLSKKLHQITLQNAKIN